MLRKLIHFSIGFGIFDKQVLEIERKKLVMTDVKFWVVLVDSDVDNLQSLSKEKWYWCTPNYTA